MGNGEWHSLQLEILFTVLGWVAFVLRSISYYPQVIMNFQRKSVVGLNFDSLIINLTKKTLFTVYNMVLYFSAFVKFQYRLKFGSNQMIPVAASDVALSTHALVLSAITLFQCFIYERNDQKCSKVATAIVSVTWLCSVICVFVAIPRHSWLWVIYIYNLLQTILSVIKPIPQAYMNFRLKSTAGFSIGNVLLSFLGSLASYLQMVVQSIDQKSMVNFYGDIGKTIISLASIFFDILFMTQHYVLYRSNTRQQLPVQSPSSNRGVNQVE